MDRRVNRTRRLLREALLALVYERGWDAVTVLDVCARADVGRSTFYAHFADKEELLTSGFDDLRRTLRAQAGDAPMGCVHALLDHLHENRRLHRALAGERMAVTVQRHFRRLLLDIVAEDLAPLLPDPRRREIAVRYVAGGVFELLLWWVDARVPEPREHVAEAVRDLTAAAVGVARTP